MWWLVCGALANPRYNADDVTFQVPKLSTALVRQEVRRALEKRKATLFLEVEGTRTPVHPGGDLKTVPRPGLMAVLLVLQPTGEVGMEYDLLFSDDDRELRPVTVWFEGPKSLAVAVGTALPGVSEGPAAEALAATYGLKGARAEGGEWEPRVRGALADALSRLGPEERARLADITLVRKGGDLRAGRHRVGKWINTAAYVSENGVARIEVYDDAVMSSSRFVGPVDAPSHPTLLVLLHELGHALADAPVRRKLEAMRAATRDYNARIAPFQAKVSAYNAAVEAYNRGERQDREAIEALSREITALERPLVQAERKALALQAEVEALGELTPVAVAFAEATGGEAPTEYGATSPEEAFAEAFALYHLDRPALQRSMPAAVAFFASGAHLR